VRVLEWRMHAVERASNSSSARERERECVCQYGGGSGARDLKTRLQRCGVGAMQE
jgi:hypothetical protein